jgi:hypothetical protein
MKSQLLFDETSLIHEDEADCLLTRADQEASLLLWRSAGLGLKRIADRFAERGEVRRRGRRSTGRGGAEEPLGNLAISLLTKIALCVVVKKIYNVLY